MDYVPSYRTEASNGYAMGSLSGVRIASHGPIHYKHLTAKRGAKYIAADGIQHGATAARAILPLQLKAKSLRNKLHDHRHSQPCFLPEHCIKELVFMDSMINPNPGEGERGTNLGGSTPDEG